MLRRLTMVGSEGARRIGRYTLCDPLAIGGMAEVFLGRSRGPVGFARTVAVKRLHPHYARDREFATMFADEARLTARLRHPNIVSTLDVLTEDADMYLVMEYEHGESIARIAERIPDRRVPPTIAASIITGVLGGLHAAHEATDPGGAPLHIVHRDVTPQNVMVGIDGVARILDFGVAKSKSNLHKTKLGQLKGKPPYMAPEQVTGSTIDRRVDVFAAGVVLWEMLTGRRLFRGDSLTSTLAAVMLMEADAPSTGSSSNGRAIASDFQILHELDEVVLCALAKHSDERFATAKEMAVAVERAVPLASAREVGEWVERAVGRSLDERAAMVARIESASEAEPAAVTLAPPPTSTRLSAGAPTMPSTRVRGATRIPGATWSLRRRVPVWPMTIAASALLCVGGALLVAGRSRPSVAGALESSASAPSASRASPIAVIATTPPPAPSAATTASADPPGPTAARGGASTVVTPQSRAASRSSPSSATPVARKPTRSSPAPHCDSPFTLDAEGRKHFSHECFPPSPGD